MKFNKNLLVITFSLLIVGCNNINTSSTEGSSTSSKGETNELLKFYKEDIIEELTHTKELLLANVSQSSVINNINIQYAKTKSEINNSTKYKEISDAYQNFFDTLYDKIPLGKENIDLNAQEKNAILKLLDEYIFRNNLIGIPLSYDGSSYNKLNLNHLTMDKWIEFFGENGKYIQTSKDKYWDVKSFLSNDNFIKGLNLAIDKTIFKKEESKTNEIKCIDISSYKYFTYDLETSRKYFKISLEEMIEEGIYKVDNLSTSIQLNLEIVWDVNKEYKEYHNHIKNCLELAFNDSSVTHNNFELKVNFYQGEYFSQIYSNKYYKGQFDLGYGNISLSANEPYAHYNNLSTNSYSKGLNINWSLDTGSLEDYIVYNGYKYSYDNILDFLE